MVRACWLSKMAWSLTLGAFVATNAMAQEAPSTNPPGGVSDQLPARRSLPALPINDLRAGASRGLDSGSDHQAADGDTSGAEGANSAGVNFNSVGLPENPGVQAAVPSSPNQLPLPRAVPEETATQSGNASGVFLRPAPQTGEPQPNFSLPGPGPSGTLTPLEPGAGQLRPQASLPRFGDEEPAAAVMNQARASRPVELMDSGEPIRDAAIQLASGISVAEAPPESRSPSRDETPDLALLFLQRYALEQAADPLPGRPMHLEEALQTVRPDLRRTVIRQYWLTWSAWANYLNQAELCTRLAAVRLPADPSQQQLVEAARMLADDERMQAEIRLNWAQIELQRMLPSSGSDLLPLPQDQPLAQAYETHYQWYVANGALPPQLRAIAQAMPKQLRLINQRANTLETAELSVRQLAQGLSGPGADVGTQLAALDLLAKAQRGLIQSVLDYNQWIADYSLTIAPPGQAPTAVAGMLVAPRRLERESGRSVLANGMGAQPTDAWTRTTGAGGEPAFARGAGNLGGLPAPRQPIERVSGLELNPRNGGAVVPAVAPAPGQAAPLSPGEGRFGTANQPANSSGNFSTEGRPNGAVGQPPAVGSPPVQPLGFSPNPSANPSPTPPPTGGSFAPPGGSPSGSFAPPPSIPSFDVPAGNSSGTEGSSGTQFKLGG